MTPHPPHSYTLSSLIDTKREYRSEYNSSTGPVIFSTSSITQSVLLLHTGPAVIAAVHCSLYESQAYYFCRTAVYENARGKKEWSLVYPRLVHVSCHAMPYIIS